ncbi:hypothetical protein F5X96DRAFT_29373 [Biscogniauxia mediterranea]|nr:hypothetical protein F5X96DRAFT_29373 [Biscogniauxia mediterranea]
MEEHDAAVSAIAERLKHFYARREPFRVYHGSTNSTRAVHKDRDKIVDTSRLNHVLGVDKDKKTALVEPNVPMDQLVAATLAHGLVPLVVMEFPGITAGGGFSGSAGESSSCRHGPFDATVLSIEIVLPDGTVARASQQQPGGENPDLFWGAASAFGTLGIVTLLEVRLRDARPFVELTHHPAASFAAALATLQAQVADPRVDFVDGIAFSPTSFVVCAGRLVDAAPPATTGSEDATTTKKKKQKVRTYLGRRDPWFYLDVRRRAAGAPGPVTDLVPLADYLFRWDRGGFWVARYAYRYFATPFNGATRRLLDRFMHARVMYHALHASGLADTYVIQDVGVPYAAAEAFYRWLDRELGIYPLWLCPLRVRRPDGGGGAAYGLHADFADAAATPEFMLNFGVWGPVPGGDDVVRLNRDIEAKLRELGGKKTLYAQAYYTEDEFWQTYNRPAYDAVRAKYRADHLPSVYDKVKVDVDGGASARAREGSRMPAALRDVRPFQGLYGVYKAWRGGDYLLGKENKKKKKKKKEKKAGMSGN